MTRMKHWQDPINVLLGIWFVVSPWVLGFQASSTPTISMVVLGVVLIAAALGASFAARAWEEWVEGVIGILMIISPWVLGFSALYNAKVDAIVTGIVVLVLALWVLATDKDYVTWRHSHAAH